MNCAAVRDVLPEFALGVAPGEDADAVELHVETFNLFNWVNFGFPARNVSNLGTLGKITTSLGDPREMQFAVKFFF